MSKRQPYREEDDIEMSRTPGYSSTPDPLLQRQQKKSQPAGRGQARKNCGWPTSIRSVMNPLWQNTRWWSTLLVVSRVIGVLFDPLFLYIPFINEGKKCMGADKGVQTAALVFRTLTDFIVVLHIFYQIGEAIETADSKVPRVTKLGDLDKDWEWGSCMTRAEMTAFTWEFLGSLPWLHFLTDIFSILPIPQVLIIQVYFNMADHDHFLGKRKLLTSCLILQYLPRIYRIYLSSTLVSRTTILVKSAFNFSLYVIASHILGALWYFFAVQRETSCWYRDCMEKKFENCAFFCNVKNPITNQTFLDSLNETCLVKKPFNMTDPPFDFGMFFDALGNDMQLKRDFPTKLGYCFWWGLRNISNFGTSLVTSTYLLENFFAILISIIGLLLFLYLIGNVQSYMQMATTKATEIENKLEKKRAEIEDWMGKKNLSKEMKEEIMAIIKLKLEDDINVDLKNISAILPKTTKKELAFFLCSNMITRVPELTGMDAAVLDSIYTFLTPVNYPLDTVIFRTGELIDRVIFITEGTLCTYKSAPQSSNAGEAESLSSMKSFHTDRLHKDDFYGNELLPTAGSSKLPLALENVKCQTDVEAFVLMQSDLEKIRSSNYNSWNSGSITVPPV